MQTDFGAMLAFVEESGSGRNWIRDKCIGQRAPASGNPRAAIPHCVLIFSVSDGTKPVFRGLDVLSRTFLKCS